MSTLGSAQVPLAASVPSPAAVVSAPPIRSRHSVFVRVTHWIISACFFALLVSGAEIVISHPRFYWGETGNVLTTPWLKLPIPSSRPLVPTGYGYVLPDRNGWSRALHFQAAWLLVFTGFVYVIAGLWTGHFRKDLVPAVGNRGLRAHWNRVAQYLRRAPPGADEIRSYNVLQRTTYLAV